MIFVNKSRLAILVAIMSLASGCEDANGSKSDPYSGRELKDIMPVYLFPSSEIFGKREYYAYYEICAKGSIEEYAKKRISEGWKSKGYSKTEGLLYITYYKQTLEKSLDRGLVKLDVECRERNSGDSGMIHMYN